MKKIVVGGVYAYLPQKNLLQETYTVEIISFLDGDDESRYRNIKCKSLQTGEILYTSTLHIRELDSIQSTYDMLLEVRAEEGEEAVKDEVIQRIEKILEIVNSSKEAAKKANIILSWLDEIEFTQEDVSLLGNIIDLCLDLHNSELCEKATSLKNKLALHVSA